MSPDDPDPVWVALRVLAVVVFGVRVAVSGRFPAAYARVARLTPGQRSRPVRVGGAQALLGAGVLAQQAPFLIPMPYPVGVALFVVALLLLAAAAGWFVLLRR